GVSLDLSQNVIDHAVSSERLIAEHIRQAYQADNIFWVKDYAPPLPHFNCSAILCEHIAQLKIELSKFLICSLKQFGEKFFGERYTPTPEDVSAAFFSLVTKKYGAICWASRSEARIFANQCLLLDPSTLGKWNKVLEQDNNFQRVLNQ